ncbi:MAG: hypothetical protein HWD85_09040 [Flavobacteriaceae bacterium]|nr:hypothetical protein [Flavobacteriaceae bacterium]
MKVKKQLIVSVISILFVMTSCDWFEDENYEGFMVSFSNHTSKVYDGVMIIGGFKNGNFVPTDSVEVPQIKLGSGVANPSYFIDKNRWKPNLDKIRKIPSERCYFKLKLSDGRSELIKRYQSSELMSLLLPSEKYFENDYGDLLLVIWDQEITGRAAKEL